MERKQTAEGPGTTGKLIHAAEPRLVGELEASASGQGEHRGLENQTLNRRNRVRKSTKESSLCTPQESQMTTSPSPGGTGGMCFGETT